MFEDLTQPRAPDAVLQQREVKVLTLRRTRPEPGKPVQVEFVFQGVSLGNVDFPNEVWLLVNKLLQKGNEANGKEGMPLAFKTVVEGVAPVVPVVPKPLKNVFPPAIENQDPEVLTPAVVKAEMEEEEQKLLERLARTLKEEK